MRITHVTLTGLYTDFWLYQDNLLPKHHKNLGNEVSIITSHFIYDDKGNIAYDKRNDYINEFGIRVQRLETKFKAKAVSKFKTYRNLYKTIASTDPEIIFIHGCQFLDLLNIIRYKENNPSVIIYVDNHADFSNSATNWVSKNILHKIIWKHFAKKIEPFTKKFYGVLPARVDFLKEIYEISEDKVDLLVMGADDDKVFEACKEKKQEELRNQYCIKPKDFLIITGGKIDQAKKQTLLLMQAVKEIQRENVKLIVFGSVVEELQNQVDSLADGIKVQYIGWVNAEDSYKYFATSDLVVFPGRHSVFWEQVVALGIPMIVKHWEGTTHIDIGGNVKFLYDDSVEEIKQLIENLINNTEVYLKMKDTAQGNKHKQFLYSEIAKKSIS